MVQLTLQWAARSEVGRRANNEDTVFASPRVAAVADGVGGAVAGEVASRFAINELIALDSRRLTGTLDAELGRVLDSANAGLRFLVDCRPELAGMGTTLTAVALSDDGDFLIANVGDSRTYLLRDGALRRLTRDQSYVQALIDEGAITPAQARAHPQRSVVLEALDGGDRAFAAPARCPARLGDRLLLCSDGVSDYLDDERIAAALATPARADAAQQLVALALEAGSRDNVSAVVADVAPRVDASSGWLDALPGSGRDGALA